MIGYAIFICSAAIAVATLSYLIYAVPRGWPVGMIFIRDDGYRPKMVAAAVTLIVLVKSFLTLDWWSPLVIVVAGYLLAGALTAKAKSWTQLICLVGLGPAGVLSLLYKSERQPFGFLQQFF